jgi:hypothetical protein
VKERLTRAFKLPAISFGLFGTIGEWKFDGFGEKSEDGFPFLLIANSFDFVAAERTQIERFATAPAHASDTVFAHDLPAMGASVCNGGSGMPSTKQRAILENNWRRFEDRYLDFRDGDVYIGRFNENLDVANRKSLTR